MTDGTGAARRLWALAEPVHAVTYFTAEARAAFEAAGLRGFWRGYFAGRAGVLGATGPAPVVAAFFGFAPPMVERALPSVWGLAAPEAALAARTAGAVTALRRVLGGGPGAGQAEIAAAADGLSTAMAGVDCSGRVLGAANAALPAPDEPLARLWLAATVLREHRGDGHVAALVAADLDGLESLVLRAGLDLSREILQPNRGWTDAEWDAAVDRMTARGLLGASAQATEAGKQLYQDIEAATDRAAARPWQAAGPAAVAELSERLAPICEACRRELPPRTPIGLPHTTS